jgi:hypothetical protein
MNPKSYDQLSLLERVLYTECFGGQDQDSYPKPVPYSLILNIRHTGWICTLDERMLNPNYYYPAPLAHYLDSIEGEKTGDRVLNSCQETSETPINSLPTKIIDEPNLDLPTKKPALKNLEIRTHDQTSSFGGQAQDSLQLNKETPTTSVFGEFWIEKVHKKINGKTYGPYLVQRWRDEQGRKRSRYLGKAPTKKAMPDSPASGQSPHSA